MVGSLTERSQSQREPPSLPLSSFSPCSRVGFYVSTFQSLAGFEEKFHKEISKVDIFNQCQIRSNFSHFISLF